MTDNPDKPKYYKVSPQEKAVLDVYDYSIYDYVVRRNNYICEQLEKGHVRRIDLAIKFGISVATVAMIKKLGPTDISHWPKI